MKRLLALLLLAPTPLMAQSTANNAVMGYLSSSNHSCGQTTCFVQYGATVPTGGGGTSDINVKQVNGAAVNVGTGAASTGTQRVAVSSDSTIGANVTPTGINVSVTPTIQNASYVSGNCMGGFQTIALGTAASVLSQVAIRSQGGLVTAKQIYLFSANPSASTCTDKSTFTINSADVSKLMLTFSITPTVPTGTTISAASQSNLGLGIPSGGNVYMAVVETTTETPATTSDLVFNFSAF